MPSSSINTYLLEDMYGWLSGKESACQCRRCGLDPWVGKIPWRGKWQPTPVFLPGKSPWQRSLAGTEESIGCRKLDSTERLNNSFRMIAAKLQGLGALKSLPNQHHKKRSMTSRVLEKPLLNVFKTALSTSCFFSFPCFLYSIFSFHLPSDVGHYYFCWSIPWNPSNFSGTKKLPRACYISLFFGLLYMAWGSQFPD